MSQPAPQSIILAAGMGKRMGSDLPKVLHEVAGRPMVAWVVDACLAVGCSRCVVVIGHKGELVRDALLKEFSPEQVVFVEQKEQLGTAHAAQMAEPLFTSPEVSSEASCDTFVLAGDGPLIRSQTLTAMLQLHRERGAALTMATSVIDDPAGYGRVVRNAAGEFQCIVEQKDASAEQLAIREVNPSYYCFNSRELFDVIRRIDNRNQAREYYITDAPAELLSQGRVVCVVDAVPPADVLSINTPVQLAAVDAILRRRLDMSVAKGNA